MTFLGLLGATIIFTWSPLFARIRAWFPAMLECAMCVGFWVGVFGWLYQHGVPARATWAEPLLYGAAVGPMALGVSLALEWMQNQVSGKGHPR